MLCLGRIASMQELKLKLWILPLTGLPVVVQRLYDVFPRDLNNITENIRISREESKQVKCCYIFMLI